MGLVWGFSSLEVYAFILYYTVLYYAILYYAIMEVSSSRGSEGYTCGEADCAVHRELACWQKQRGLRGQHQDGPLKLLVSQGWPRLPASVQLCNPFRVNVSGILCCFSNRDEPDHTPRHPRLCFDNTESLERETDI